MRPLRVQVPVPVRLPASPEERPHEGREAEDQSHQSGQGSDHGIIFFVRIEPIEYCFVPEVILYVKSVDPGLGSDQTFIALLRNEAGSEYVKIYVVWASKYFKE